MIPTLILLYALDSFVAIPQGCFIAAWVLTAVGFVLKVIEFAKKDDKK